MAQISTHRSGRSVTLCNDAVQVVVHPERGGRMSSLLSRTTGREFLLQEDAPRPVSYGDPFHQHPPSGFDECFPTVAPSSVAYSRQDPAVSLPDHGELWCRAWGCETTEEGLYLWIEGKRLPYRFKKQIRLQDHAVKLSYTVHNWGASALPYVWAAHPLLCTDGATQLELPSEVDTVFLYWASDVRLGRRGDALPWPTDDTRPLLPDLSRVPSDAPEVALKAFTDALSTGTAALHFSHPDERLRFVFDPDTVPYLGLWLCYDGWPPTRPWSQHAVALEPTCSPTDALRDAVAGGACPVVGPGDSHSWTLELQILSQYGSS